MHLAIRARNLESVRTLTIKSRDKAQHMQNRDNKFPLNLAAAPLSFLSSVSVPSCSRPKP